VAGAGIWASPGGEGAKFWLGVLTELRNRGVADACIVVCDGLNGLPDAITTTWPVAVMQTCVLHLIRATFPRRPPRSQPRSGSGLALQGDVRGREPDVEEGLRPHLRPSVGRGQLGLGPQRVVSR
jgi:hypothetical protein